MSLALVRLRVPEDYPTRRSLHSIYLGCGRFKDLVDIGFKSHPQQRVVAPNRIVQLWLLRVVFNLETNLLEVVQLQRSSMGQPSAVVAQDPSNLSCPPLLLFRRDLISST